MAKEKNEELHQASWGVDTRHYLPIFALITQNLRGRRNGATTAAAPPAPRRVRCRVCTASRGVSCRAMAHGTTVRRSNWPSRPWRSPEPISTRSPRRRIRPARGPRRLAVGGGVTFMPPLFVSYGESLMRYYILVYRGEGGGHGNDFTTHGYRRWTLQTWSSRRPWRRRCPAERERSGGSGGSPELPLTVFLEARMSTLCACHPLEPLVQISSYSRWPAATCRSATRLRRPATSRSVDIHRSRWTITARLARLANVVESH